MLSVVELLLKTGTNTNDIPEESVSDAIKQCIYPQPIIQIRHETWQTIYTILYLEKVEIQI